MPWKQIVLLCVTLGFVLFLTEVGFRVFYAFKVGPSILVRGFVAAEVRTKDYTKYRPHEIRLDTDMDTMEQISTRMNSRGFRGDEFEQRKAENTVRVVTLGASSTFGFRDRDNETYPYFLEEILNERCGDSQTFEVINLGIPHLEARHIYALFVAEGADLAPDVVTFYEGVNDSASTTGRSTATGAARRKLRDSWVRIPYRWLRDNSVFLGFLDQVTTQEVSEVSPADLATVAAGKSEVFLDYLGKIRSEAEHQGALFIVANQQSRSLFLDRDEIEGVTYQQEVSIVEERLDDHVALSGNERYFLIHSQLMADVERWAGEEAIPFVDVIEALDQRRDTIVSWVHLNAAGNRVVAKALASPILDSLCTQQLGQAS